MYWLRHWGRRIPLPLVVLVVPTVVALLAARWSPAKRFADAVGTWHWISPVTIPGIALIFFGTCAATLLVTRDIAQRSPEGPLTVARIIDTTPPDVDSGSFGDTAPPRRVADHPAGGTSPNSVRALTVETILRDRLAATGTAPRGLIPATGSLNLTAEQPISAGSEDAYGLLTRLGLGVWRSSTQRLGWRVTGTLLRTDDPANSFGLAVVVEHVATRRHVFTRTVWAPTPEKATCTAAYEIAAWRFLRLAPHSTRSSLHWRPTAKSLGAYTETAHCVSDNRFDEAVHQASLGLAADPANHALRRLLGECYEWLGHFESALHTYASGLAMIHDDQNGWTRSAIDETHDARWPQGGRARPHAWPPHNLIDGQPISSGLVLRYIVMLQYADQWVDRWIAALERHEMRQRKGLGNAGEERWSDEAVDLDPHFAARYPRLAANSQRQFDRSNTPARDEEARRLRGFFHQRYHYLLEKEYPLLNRMWFSELDDRHRHFGPPQDDALPASSRTPEPRPLPSPLDDRLEAEHHRFPWHRGKGRPHHRIRPRAGNHTNLDPWVDELQWLFGDLLESHLSGQADSLPSELDRNKAPTSMSGVAVEVLRRLGMPVRPGGLRQVSNALRDENAWKQLHLNQQLIGAAASWAAHRLLRLPTVDNPQRGGHGPGQQREQQPVDARSASAPIQLDATQRGRLLALSEQLDLRSFVFRATLFELDRPARRPVPRGLRPVSSTLRDLFWLTARFHYLDRLHHLAGHDAQREQRGTLRRETADHARRISRSWAVVARLRPAPEEWSVWYYSACAQAAVIPPAPEPATAPATTQRETRPREDRLSWVKDNDAFAEYSVRTLNQSILVRRRNGLTLIEAGARDWMLRRDPDLQNLRAHPRFQRWVSAAFCMARLEAEDEDEAIMTQLRDQDWRNDGTFGAEPRWNAWSRRWRAINDTYLVEHITDLALMIAYRWRALQARAAQRDAGWEREVAELMACDVEAWRHLAAYRRFAWNPVMRHTAMTTLIRAAGHRTLHTPFPSRNDPLLRPHILLHTDLDDLLESLVSTAEEAARRLGDDPAAGSLPRRRIPRLPRSDSDNRNGPDSLTQTCKDAAVRWERLLAHFTDGTAPGTVPGTGTGTGTGTGKGTPSGGPL